MRAATVAAEALAHLHLHPLLLLAVAAHMSQPALAAHTVTMALGLCIPAAFAHITVMATVTMRCLTGPSITETADGHTTALPMTGREPDRKNMVHSFAFTLRGL